MKMLYMSRLEACQYIVYGKVTGVTILHMVRLQACYMVSYRRDNILYMVRLQARQYCIW